MPAHSRPKRTPKAVDPFLGQIVGGHFLEAPLGKGAHGSCYLAYRVGCRSKEICVKVITEADQAKNEMTNMELMQELKIVPKLLFQETLNGLEVIGMDLAYDTIETYMKAVKWPLGPQKFEDITTVRVLLQCLSGLREVHALNIVHMDIKTDNVFVTRPYDCGRAVSLLLGDFGMSTRLEISDGELKQVPGQPEYMVKEMVHSSPNVHRRGGVHGFLEDIHQLSYMGLMMAGFDLNTNFKTISGCLKFKQSLLSNPAAALSPSVQWMVPFFVAINQQDPLNISYQAIERSLKSLVKARPFNRNLRLRKKEQTLYLE